MTEKDELIEALKELKKAVEDQGDTTRNHVSAVVDGIAHSAEMTKQGVYDIANEQRGQLTGIKDRVQYLIKIVDGWLHGKKPPAP